MDSPNRRATYSSSLFYKPPCAWDLPRRTRKDFGCGGRVPCNLPGRNDASRTERVAADCLRTSRLRFASHALYQRVYASTGLLPDVRAGDVTGTWRCGAASAFATTTTNEQNHFHCSTCGRAFFAAASVSSSYSTFGPTVRWITLCYVRQDFALLPRTGQIPVGRQPAAIPYGPGGLCHLRWYPIHHLPPTRGDVPGIRRGVWWT